MKTVKIDDGIIKIKKVELVEVDNINKHTAAVYKILKALGHSEALVTNESKIYDFCFAEKDLDKYCNKISKKLGIKVNHNDYIWKLAERIQNEK